PARSSPHSIRCPSGTSPAAHEVCRFRTRVDEEGLEEIRIWGMGKVLATEGKGASCARRMKAHAECALRFDAAHPSGVRRLRYRMPKPSPGLLQPITGDGHRGGGALEPVGMVKLELRGLDGKVVIPAGDHRWNRQSAVS